MPAPTHRFFAPLCVDPQIPDGYMRNYLPLPEETVAALAGASHVEGTLDGQAFRRSVHTRSDGQVCLRFGKGWLKDAGIEPGAVTLAEDLEPDRVDLPEALQEVLAARPEAQAAWMDLSPGRQRTLVYGIQRAKQHATRIRRAQKLAEELAPAKP